MGGGGAHDVVNAFSVDLKDTFQSFSFLLPPRFHFDSIKYQC